MIRTPLTGITRTIDPERFSVTHFARQYSERGYGGPGFNPEEWQWLGDILFKAIQIDRDIIVPQIAVLIADIDVRPC